VVIFLPVHIYDELNLEHHYNTTSTIIISRTYCTFIFRIKQTKTKKEQLYQNNDFMPLAYAMHTSYLNTFMPDIQKKIRTYALHRMTPQLAPKFIRKTPELAFLPFHVCVLS
jgi:hypothetical protein